MSRISNKVRSEIRKRANERCEYCQLPEIFSFQPFQVDHILSIKHGGSDKKSNLAWTCANCNNAKGSDLGSYDTETGDLVPFYNPRAQEWHSHFEIDASTIIGKTPEGRVTVLILKMNEIEYVEIRHILIESNLWE
ncbi:MAG: HNH endonuclease signature motif containing protein [Anaerolineae bacterium]|nr:HNH endonuclease signature motif containing protein [Anaerolineae bacterium]